MAHWVLVRAGSCTVAASGVARQNLGSWSKRYGWVWAARFTQVRAPGRYRVGILGDASAASPWFAIGSAAQLYARPLANALYFYENERDGPDFIHTALRSAPGHLNDLSAMTYRTPPVDDNGNFQGSLAKYATGVRINASGGWFDAGDYLHFVETTSYTEAVLLQGVASFPRQMGSGVSAGSPARTSPARSSSAWTSCGGCGTSAPARSTTRWARARRTATTSRDHDIWRLPQADDHYHGTNPHDVYVRHPPVFRAGRPGAKISPNLAGRLAADFALCYQVLRHSDPGYADGCLRSAETVYSLADPHWKGHLMTAIPWDFYPETSWRDDMMLGATELARALQDAGHPAALPAGLPVRSAATYLRDAAAWASAWIHSKQALGDTLNLYDVSALADYELVLSHPRAARQRPGRDHGPAPGQPARADREGHPHRGQRPVPLRVRLGPVGHHHARRRADGDGGRVRRAGRPAVYAAWAQRWLDDILGSNAWGVSLIVGDGTVFPDCMQHQVANLAGSLDGQPPILAGAAVEGPNSFAATGTVPNMRRCAANAPGDIPYASFNGQHAVFADNVQSYSTVEPGHRPDRADPAGLRLAGPARDGERAPGAVPD